jgi:demethylmenaquinone methyltransferase/2-methoxy-6-polyprenyl-1,4-benzoquinol methylase
VSALPSGPEKARVVRSMFDRVARRYDVVNRVMTFGLDVGWRRRTAEALRLPAGARVVDVACGTGDLCAALEHAGLLPIGVDFSAGMLAHAGTDAPLVQADALRLPFADASIDGITCGFALRNVTDLRALFAEIARALRTGGRVALLETAEPEGRVMRTGHRVYFRRVVPVLGGALSDRAAYAYLPRSMAYLPSPGELSEMLASSGFTDVRRTALAGGVAQLLTGTRR